MCSLVRALGKLPGGIGRFLPFSVGGDMSRLRHLGWGQCSHGLTSRPLESCHRNCLHAVCVVSGSLLHHCFYQAGPPLVSSRTWQG